MEPGGKIGGRVAIVGVGTTRQGEHPGRSAEEIGIDALKLALADAGISKNQIDGLITCKTYVQGCGIDTNYAQLLGIDPPFSSALDYGSCNFSLHLAAMVIESGLANTVALIYGNNQRTNKLRFTQSSVPDADFAEPYGYFHMSAPLAMAFRRHQHLYGTTERQLGLISVGQREAARLNPLAIFQNPLSIEGYLASKYVVAPFRRPDMTMISDGGAALIVTSAERVSEFRTSPVYVLGIAQQSGAWCADQEGGVMRPWLRDIASRIYPAAGVERRDVDALFIQDPFSYYVMEMLEAYGFCGEGEAGAFIEEGRIRLGGDLPVNTNGGQLSESYMWGWLHLCEAARQLRGECGPRQVKGAEIVQYCSTMGLTRGASTIMANHR